jgi:hypothetical protein
MLDVVVLLKLTHKLLLVNCDRQLFIFLQKKGTFLLLRVHHKKRANRLF